MSSTKSTFVTGFALFSLFFGSGNLILPPFLGFNSGSNWPIVTVGFVITAVIIPILGIYAHAKLQGTMYDFAKPISSTLSLVYCFIMYTIAIGLPAPRTAAVTHEMAIVPYFNVSSITTSCVYFILVLIFALNRSRILNILGRFLTPILLLALLLIIILSVFVEVPSIDTSNFETPFISGLLEGYQTFDAIGAVVVGAILVISIKSNTTEDYSVVKSKIFKSGLIAGLGLLVIYTGLIFGGSTLIDSLPITASRVEVLQHLITTTIGNKGALFLSVLIALACFTTAVGIITGTADYVKGRFNNSESAYKLTAIIACVLGVIIGQLNVSKIIAIALPVLMFIYPITIVLIILNTLPKKWASDIVFKAVVLVTFICTLPDVLKFITPSEALERIAHSLPFAKHSLGWVLPALASFVLVNVYDRFINPTKLSKEF